MERIAIFIRKPSARNLPNKRVGGALNHLRPLLSTVVISIAFLIIEVRSSAISRRYGNRWMLMSASNQHTSCLNFVRNASRSIQSNYHFRPSVSTLSKIRTKKTPAVTWVYGPSFSSYRIINRHSKSIFRIKSTPDPPISGLPWRDQMIRRPCGSCSVLFTRHDSSSIQAAQSTGCLSNINSSAQLDARHWFTQLLPEGWCVGVRTGHAADEKELALSSTDLLHPEEYRWGLDHIASDASRTSYYLGRMALRSSLGALLDSEKTTIDSTRKETDDFYIQLHDQIQTTAINKDYYGRPILPEIISGSISHKGEYAVGLARFRSSTLEAQSRLFDKGLDALNASPVAWKEECPILDQDENIDQDDRDGVSCFSSPLSVRGIGIDLERIDASRGRRIERKVLTESEQLELGGLEVSGCRYLQ